MPALRYEAPTSIDAATSLLAENSKVAKILAGGTDVIVQMHSEKIEPKLIVDIKNIPELRKIEKTDDGFKFGAAISGKELMLNEEFNNVWPGIMDGVRLIGSLQIRGRASVGGNLCNASPAADSVPPLIAAAAVANIIGPSGSRDIPVEEVIIKPGQTSLSEGEIIVSFQLPNRPPKSGDAYLRFTPRTEMDIAVVGCGVNLSVENNNISAVRVVLGAVGPKVIFSEEASNSLLGTSVNADSLSKLQEVCEKAANPIDDKRGTIDFRRKVAGVLAKRAVEKAYKRIMEDS